MSNNNFKTHKNKTKSVQKMRLAIVKINPILKPVFPVLII